MIEQKTKKRLAGKGLFPPSLAFSLLLPVRNLILSPRRLIDRMNLRKNATVLELGPGPGYFSLPVARYLSAGKLYLADIQPEMLAKAQRRLSKNGITNAEYCLLNGQNLPFADTFFDAAFMVTVLGEVENQAEYLAELARILKPGALLSVSEQFGDPDMIGRSALLELLRPYGFTVRDEHGNKLHYTVNFTRQS